MAFPAIFIITGIALDKLYLFGRKNSKYLGIILVAAILAFGAYQNIGSSTALIENKATSYVQVEEAGIWIKANSAPSDNIISSSVPQNNFYSERATYPYPNNESDFAALLKNLTPKYIVLSAWEPSPSWAYNWPANNNATVRPVVVYYGDQQKTQISLVIYQLN